MLPDLERCPDCDARFDPAALDEVLFHATAECMKPDGKITQTGIRGVLVAEPPQA